MCFPPDTFPAVLIPPARKDPHFRTTYYGRELRFSDKNETEVVFHSLRDTFCETFDIIEGTGM